MKTRILFAILAGLAGALLGSGIAFVLREEGESLPLHIVAAPTVIFALCGAFAKRRWIDALYDFVLHIMP